jgi:hypothetical protein
VLIRRVCGAFDRQLLVQAALCLHQPLLAGAWDRPGLDGALLIEVALGAAQPLLAALACRELGR